MSKENDFCDGMYRSFVVKSVFIIYLLLLFILEECIWSNK